MTTGTISPGWRKPERPTGKDRERVRLVILKAEESARFWEHHGKTTAATVAQAHADEWRRRLDSMV